MNDNDYPITELNSDTGQQFSDGRCTRCPICEKIFFVPTISTYAYKIKNINRVTRYVCSWKCLNKAKPLVQRKRIYKNRDNMYIYK